MKNAYTTLTFEKEKALAGHPLITRDGIVVTNFRINENAHNDGYPFKADFEGSSKTFAEDGYYFSDGISDGFDLFLMVENNKTLTKFNLNKAKNGAEMVCVGFDKTKPVKFVAHVPNANENCRIVVLDDAGDICCFDEKGCYFDTPTKLFMVEKTIKHEAHLNLFKNGKIDAWKTKEAAEQAQNRYPGFVEYRKIEWETTE